MYIYIYIYIYIYLLGDLKYISLHKTLQKPTSSVLLCSMHSVHF